MADTKPAAEEATNNPAEVTKTEEQVELTKDAKDETADGAEATNAEKVADAKSEEIIATDDKPAEAKSEESEEKANGAQEKRNGDKYDRRNGDKYHRSNKRGNDRYSDKSRNKKSRPNEFADLPETDDPVEIRQQVEFYFSTQNLSTDKHMFFEVDGPNNRPVSIKHLHTFKRMRRFQPYSAIVAALRDSDQLVVVDEGDFAGAGKEAVQRKEPIAIPEYDRDEKQKPSTQVLFDRLFHRSRNSLDASIYVKGFGDEDAAGQIALENFFKPYGAVMVRKRRDEDDKWKGSVFVEFDGEESQQQFLALDPKPKFNDNELTILSKKEYSEMKCKEKGITPAWERKAGAGEGTRGQYHHDRRSGRGGRGRGRYNDRSGRYNDRSGRRDRDRSRSRSRSPYERRRRYRSESRSSEGSGDSRDWNNRRDKFQKSREFKDERRGKKHYDSDNKWGIKKDRDGVPIVQDTRGQPDESPKSNKRKGEDIERDETSKKSKVEIKEDA